MPDETPEQKTARETEEKRQKELDDRIIRGVTAGVAPLIAKLNERETPAPTVRTEAPTVITRPTDEQIAQAQIDGNVTELARLRKMERAADAQERQRELQALAQQGGSAISSVSQSLAEQNPDYKKYKKEIDAELNQFKASNPSAIVTTEHIRIATDIVKARHIDEIVNERIEETRRQAREAEEALLPENQHHEEREEKEPTTLAEALDVPDWTLWREKQREVGGRTEDAELRKMGFKDGLPSFLATRKEMSRIAGEVGSGMGLDRDWSCKAHDRAGCPACIKSNAEGDYA